MLPQAQSVLNHCVELGNILPDPLSLSRKVPFKVNKQDQAVSIPRCKLVPKRNSPQWLGFCWSWRVGTAASTVITFLHVRVYKENNVP
jgi:hypothetical protein